jgi:predicted nucleotidyltransferase
MASNHTSQLLSALMGQTRQRVLALLYGHPEEAFYLREVVRRTEGGVGAVARELARLTEAGLLVSHSRGQHSYYQANRGSPVFHELRGLIAKTEGLGSVLSSALLPLADRIEFGFIYGSVARGEEGPASDVDLMIVGQVSFREVIGALQRAQQQLAREINPTVYPPREFRDRLSGRHPFLAAVMNAPRLMILGTDDELAGLVEERMARQPRSFQDRDNRSSRRDRTRSG